MTASASVPHSAVSNWHIDPLLNTISSNRALSVLLMQGADEGVPWICTLMPTLSAGPVDYGPVPDSHVEVAVHNAVHAMPMHHSIATVPLIITTASPRHLDTSKPYLASPSRLSPNIEDGCGLPRSVHVVRVGLEVNAAALVENGLRVDPSVGTDLEPFPAHVRNRILGSDATTGVVVWHIAATTQAY